MSPPKETVLEISKNFQLYLHIHEQGNTPCTDERFPIGIGIDIGEGYATASLSLDEAERLASLISESVAAKREQVRSANK